MRQERTRELCRATVRLRDMLDVSGQCTISGLNQEGGSTAPEVMDTAVEYAATLLPLLPIKLLIARYDFILTKESTRHTNGGAGSCTEQCVVHIAHAACGHQTEALFVVFHNWYSIYASNA